MRMALAGRLCLLALSVGALLVPLLPFLLTAGETATFLKIPIGARVVGMGSAFTALANDISTIQWNPAGLSLIPSREIGATHTELFLDTRHDFFGYAHPTSLGTLAGSFIYLSQGAIAQRDENRNPLGGSFTASDLAATISFSRKLLSLPKTLVGINLKFLQSQIADVSATAIAIDLGAIYQSPIAYLNLALTIQNLGTAMRFIDQTESLPLTLTTGLSYQLLSTLNLAMDFKVRPNTGKTSISLGSEYPIFPALAIRAGYRLLSAFSPSPLGGEGGGEGFGFAAGFGLKLFAYQLDYAITPMEELGNTQRISLSARF